MKKIEDLVSIVVPVYNVEKYVAKCIDSIIKQSYPNIEIIIVNDGSKDNSDKIIKKYQRIDNRIKYIKKRNGGLSSARNRGIEEASGKYICFIDSDDYIDQNYINILISRIIKDNSDIAICNMKYIYQDGEEKKPPFYITDNKTINNKEALQYLFLGKQFQNHAVNKLYKLSIFKENDIRFPINKIYEDVFTIYKTLLNAKKISLCNDYLYFYLREREGSILTSKFNEKRFDILEAMSTISKEDFLDDLKLKNEFKLYCTNNINGLFYYIFPYYSRKTKKEWVQFFNQIKNHDSIKIIKDPKYNKCISITKRIQIYLVSHKPELYCYIMKMIKRG